MTAKSEQSPCLLNILTYRNGPFFHWENQDTFIKLHEYTFNNVSMSILKCFCEYEL